MVVGELVLDDVEGVFEFGVLFGLGGEVREVLLELADLGRVEARAAMIKRIRY